MACALYPGERGRFMAKARNTRRRNQACIHLETLEDRVVMSTSATSALPTPAHPAIVHTQSVSTAQTTTSPLPVVDHGQLHYSLSLQPVSIPDAPALQSAVYAQAGGLWLFFGGRTNGLHGFGNGQNFPPEYQNRDIIVINPHSGQVWTHPWSDSSLSTASVDALTSTNMEFYQQGNRLYVAGGYGVDSSTNVSTTFDTLTSINVAGLIRSVIHGTDPARQIQQIHDPRVQVTGGEMDPLGHRTYLVLGQNFQGDYFAPNAVQKYTDQIRSFQIVNTPHYLGIRNYSALTDPIQYHRRDYNLVPAVLPNRQPALVVHGGVFTLAGGGWTQPITITRNGQATIDTSYNQFFSQYKTTTIPLYSAHSHTSQTLSLGGISLYTYNPSTGQIAEDPNLPFINTITSMVESPSGSFQEYVLPNQLPGLLGAESAFLRSPSVPAYPNGVIALDHLRRPTTLGYMYGGIQAQVPNFGPSTATAQIFKIILTPQRGS